MEAPDSFEDFDEVYMVTPLYDKDLSKILESNVALTDEHNQYFIYQILCALKYLHRYRYAIYLHAIGMFPLSFSDNPCMSSFPSFFTKRLGSPSRLETSKHTYSRVVRSNYLRFWPGTIC